MNKYVMYTCILAVAMHTCIYCHMYVSHTSEFFIKKFFYKIPCNILKLYWNIFINIYCYTLNAYGLLLSVIKQKSTSTIVLFYYPV